MRVLGVIIAVISVIVITEGSLEVKLPTIWTDEKQRWEESEKRREEKGREEKRREEKKKEDQTRDRAVIVDHR